MGDWKEKFDNNTLERGKNYYDKKRVDHLKETDGIWSAAVLGRERYEISVRGYGSDAVRMSCRCPVARSGRCCEHMAAVLYAVDAANGVKDEEVTAAELMAQWVKYDEELRAAEKQKEEKPPVQADTAPKKPRRKRRTKQEMEEARREMEAKAAETLRRHEEEKAQRERQAAEAVEQERQRKEQEAEEARQAAQKRLAREQRKAERRSMEAERKQAAEQERLARLQKQAAEQERREEIRRQKEAEAKQRAEKRAREQEEARKLAELREKEERKKRAAQKRGEEARRQKEEADRREEAERRHREEMKVQNQKKADRTAGQKRRQTEYELFGSPWAEEAQTAADTEKGLEELEHYSYFDGAAIRGSVRISRAQLKEAGQLLESRDLVFQEVISGYSRMDGEICGQLTATGRQGKGEFPVNITFSRVRVLGIQCGCPKCSRNYYSSWYPGNVSCAYTAAALLLTEEYLSGHNLGDATDENGQVLLTYCQGRRVNRLLSDTAAKSESLALVPRLIKKDDGLMVSFKVGEKKLFVVKNLSAFCENVKNSATGTYGSSTQINHSPDRFTESGRGWIRFISRIVREEEAFLQRLQESRYYYYKTKNGVGSELNLSGWRLDEFYGQLGDDGVEFEDRDGRTKKKAVLTAARSNPKVTLQIAEEKLGKGDEFHGIRVSGSLPELYYGSDTAYYIEGTHLCRVDEEFLGRVEPLAEIADESSFCFSVGRNRMAEFYYHVLPGLREIATVKEIDAERVRSYLLPEVRFAFYLDAEEGNAVCEVFARYGEREFAATDVIREDDYPALEPFRDVPREMEVLRIAMQWLPEIDLEGERLHCGGDEEKIYFLMESGVQSLAEIGEVRCTKRFLGYQAVKSVRVSVGVSVSSGLLELEISTEDVPQAELLELLNSYRMKKKYYRLKDGAFVNLSESSMEMLAELMESAHVKPKELIKGKMQLPMYRTLYLDKLLEEHESVYSSRDAHFREIIKGFKTVKDADFEEPESLRRIMRNYQKNGYKWLRTVESWQFGGILADDMGLGKTLQVIAVLLAAKEEGQQGISLVVAPASLVYNWEEEFGRFAPALRVVLIAGTQEERQRRLEHAQEADVLVTSYDLLKRDIASYEELEFLYEVIDEAQYIKNHTTAAAKAVKVIKSRTRFALTGTPIENRLSELWSIFDYLMPGFLYGYDVFRKELETPIVKSGDETAMQRLQKMVGPFILRRLKGDVLRDLPKKLEEERFVRLEDAQRKLYDGQVVHMRESLARQDDAEFQKNRMQILAELTRLRQICCDPSLCFENYDSGSAKLEACVELIRSAADGGHRMLVFSQFTSMLEILRQRLEAEEIACYTITGATSKENRLQLVKDFNEGEVPVFLISLKAGGVGLNLTGADIVIHYDPWWNVAVQNQATDRAHRIGQTKRVTVYKLIAKNTIEEKIQKLQETKRDLAEQVIGGDASRAGSLSREDLLQLLEV